MHRGTWRKQRETSDGRDVAVICTSAPLQGARSPEWYLVCRLSHTPLQPLIAGPLVSVRERVRARGALGGNESRHHGLGFGGWPWLPLKHGLLTEFAVNWL